MKTIYSITIILLTTLIISSCNSDGNSILTLEEASRTLSTNIVQEDVFSPQRNIYDYGLRMVPDSITWDSNSNTITYTKKVLDETSDSILIRLFNEKHKGKNRTFSFSNNSSLAKSYFIKKEDIDALSKILNNHDQNVDKPVNGVRVYMAAGNKNEYSHVYLGPAYLTEKGANNKNYYVQHNGANCLYDLTTPCPNACGGKYFDTIKL